MPSGQSYITAERPEDWKLPGGSKNKIAGVSNEIAEYSPKKMGVGIC
jgi:hypothetical protein